MLLISRVNYDNFDSPDCISKEKTYLDLAACLVHMRFSSSCGKCKFLTSSKSYLGIVEFSK